MKFIRPKFRKPSIYITFIEEDEYKNLNEVQLKKYMSSQIKIISIHTYKKKCQSPKSWINSLDQMKLQYMYKRILQKILKFKMESVNLDVRLSLTKNEYVTLPQF